MGFISDRTDVKHEIQKLGLEIARETPRNLSIKHPEGGRNIRLEGIFYEESYRLSGQNTQAIRNRTREYQDGSQKRYEKAYQSISQRLRKRAGEHRKKYISDKQNINTTRGNDIFNNITHDSQRLAKLAIEENHHRKSPDRAGIGEISKHQKTEESQLIEMGREQRRDDIALHRKTGEEKRGSLRNRKISSDETILKLLKLKEKADEFLQRTRTHTRAISERFTERYGIKSATAGADRATFGSQRQIETTEQTISRISGEIEQRKPEVNKHQQRINQENRRIDRSQGVGFSR